MERKKSLVICPACRERRHDFRDKEHLCPECSNAVNKLVKAKKEEKRAENMDQLNKDL